MGLKSSFRHGKRTLGDCTIRALDSITTSLEPTCLTISRCDESPNDLVLAPQCPCACMTAWSAGIPPLGYNEEVPGIWFVDGEGRVRPFGISAIRCLSAVFQDP